MCLGPLFNSTLFWTAGEAEDGGGAFVHGGARRRRVDRRLLPRRFGPEAVTYVAEPPLAGFHAGDAERLSMRALFPR